MVLYDAVTSSTRLNEGVAMVNQNKPLEDFHPRGMTMAWSMGNICGLAWRLICPLILPVAT